MIFGFIIILGLCTWLGVILFQSCTFRVHSLGWPVILAGLIMVLEVAIYSQAVVHGIPVLLSLLKRCFVS